MTTLRTAAQQALEALKMMRDEYEEYACPACDHAGAAIYALRAALAEPVQEPVAWRYKPMVGSPWSLSDDGYYISCKRDKDYIIEPLYTAPPQRKPRRLTDAEIGEVWFAAKIPGLIETQARLLIRAAERRLAGEK